MRGSGKGAVRPYTGGNHDGSRGTTGGYWVRNEGGKDANSLYKAPRGSYTEFDVEKGEERGSNSGPRVVGSDRGRKWSGIETDKANGPYESSLEWSSDNSESSSLLENPKFANLSISDQQQHTSHERREIQNIQSDLQALLKTVNRRYEKPKMSATSSNMMSAVISKIGNDCFACNDVV